MNKLLRIVFFAPLLIAFTVCLPARAGTDAGLVFKPWGERQHLEVDSEALFQSSGTVRGSVAGPDDRIGINQYSFDFRLRPFPKGSHQLAFGGHLYEMAVNGDSAVLGPRLMNQSYAIGFKAGEIAPGWQLGVVAGVGYSGSAPFTRSSSFYAKGSLAAIHKIDEQTNLGILLDYNGNRDFLPDWPIPTIVWQHVEGENFALVLGIPIAAIHWKPKGTNWTFDASYTPPVSVDVKIQYALNKHWFLYTSYKHMTKVFHRDGYDSNRRLFFDQQRAEAGIKWKPLPMLRLKAGGGFAFSQSFSRGWDSRDLDTLLLLHDEPYFRMHMTLFF